MVLASILWFIVMYFCFHVRGGCGLSPRFCQFVLLLGWQNNYSAMSKACWINFVGFV